MESLKQELVRYYSDHPNHVHQLLVAVSTHYLVGAKGVIRYQKKPIDVSLKNFTKTGREHLVYYVIRDHFSGFYYVEVASTASLIRLEHFLLRSILPKPELAFWGRPDHLMITKQVRDFFPETSKMMSELGMKTLEPTSGFASGIRAVTDWERHMKVPLIPSEGFTDLWHWNPRTSARYLNMLLEDKLKKWAMFVPSLKAPSNVVAMQLGGKDFRFINKFPLYEPVWKQLSRT